MNKQEIYDILPYSGNFRLLDSCRIMEEGIHSIGMININSRCWFFDGHFANEAVMPGVMIIESLAHVAAVTALTSGQYGKGKMYFVKINNAVFKKPIIPVSEQEYPLYLEAKFLEKRKMFASFECTAYKESGDSRVICTTANITATIIDDK